MDFAVRSQKLLDIVMQETQYLEVSEMTLKSINICFTCVNEIYAIIEQDDETDDRVIAEVEAICLECEDFLHLMKQKH